MAGLDTAIVIIGVATLVPFIEMLLFQSVRRRARRDLVTGEAILEYGRGLKGLFVFGALFFSFVALGTAGAFESSSANLRGRITLAALFVPFIALYCVGIAEVFGAWGRFDSEAITKHSPWKGKLSLAWSEIQSIKYSPTNRWFVLHSARGKIRISNYLNGIGELLAIARERVPPEKWAAPSDHAPEAHEPLTR